MSKVALADRVLLVGKHPWVGHSGVVVEKDMAGVVHVRLDTGTTVMAWPRQYRKLQSNA